MSPIDPVLNIVILLVFSLTLKGVLDYAIKIRPTSPASQWIGAGLLMASATGFGFGFMHGLMNVVLLLEYTLKAIQQ